MEKMTFSYDQESDIMYFSLGRPKTGIDTEVEDGVFIRKNQRGKVSGFLVMDFKKRFKKNTDYTIPIAFGQAHILTAKG